MGSLSNIQGIRSPRKRYANTNEAIEDLSDIVARLVRDSQQPPRWDDLRISAHETSVLGPNPPDWTTQFKNNGSGSTGVFIPYFDDTVEEELYFAVQLPHTWLEESDIYPHVHWAPNANGSAGQVVNWGLEYTWANFKATYGNTTIISANAHIEADSALVADKHYITAFSAISGTGKTISSMLICRLFRDATGALGTDSYGDDAGLLEIDFHLQHDTNKGSQIQYSKWDR